MADPTNKVPFFLAGDGAYLRFRTIDLIGLEDEFGEDWQAKVYAGLNRTSHKVLVSCLKVGLKQQDGRKPFGGVSFDDLPFSIDDAAGPIVDAIALGISGKDYATLVAAREEARQEALRNPPMTDDPSESGLSPLDTPQDS